MRIEIGARFRDYMNIPYVVKDYKNSIITFEVDNGNMKDEKYSKKEFMSEIDGNRFHVDRSISKISDKEIEKAADEYALKYPGENRWDGFIHGITWYREQLKQRK